MEKAICRSLGDWAQLLVMLATLVVELLRRTERTRPEYRELQDVYKILAEAHAVVRSLADDYCGGDVQVPPLPKPPMIKDEGF